MEKMCFQKHWFPEGILLPQALQMVDTETIDIPQEENISFRLRLCRNHRRRVIAITPLDGFPFSCS